MAKLAKKKNEEFNGVNCFIPILYTYIYRFRLPSLLEIRPCCC